MQKRMTSVLICLLALAISVSAAAEGWSFAGTAEKLYDENTAYILNPPTLPEAPKTEHEFMNILLLGADYGLLTPGRGKNDIKNCHTDSIIMIAIDLTANHVSMISIPRDTLTYVPGAYGIYKLNAAVNCADNLMNGIEKTMDTVGWLLGGIRPDHYMLITPTLVERVGDSVGGLDIDVKMKYTVTTAYSGRAERTYEKGMQHLDGVGIIDYARARTNAGSNTANRNDLDRTDRQRQVLTALFAKISQDTDLVYDILDTLVENFDQYFFTDMSIGTMWDMLDMADQLASGSVSNYVLDGELTMAMKYFNFNFFDQNKRQQILREVYGVDLPKQRLNSHSYVNYLYKNGLAAVKAVRVSNRVIAWAEKAGYQGREIADAKEARLAAIEAISAVDDSLEQKAINKTEKAMGNLKQAVANLRKACGYPDKLGWAITGGNEWYIDPDINEYYDIDWH